MQGREVAVIVLFCRHSLARHRDWELGDGINALLGEAAGRVRDEEYGAGSSVLDRCGRDQRGEVPDLSDGQAIVRSYCRGRRNVRGE